MKKWYSKDNGQTILFGEEDEVTIQHPDAKEISFPKNEHEIWNGTKWVEDEFKYQRDRADKYPHIGDQLDAILKQFNYMQMTMARDDIPMQDKILRAFNAIEDLDGIISKWLKVKRKYPKTKKRKDK